MTVGVGSLLDHRWLKCLSVHLQYWHWCLSSSIRPHQHQHTNQLLQNTHLYTDTARGSSLQTLNIYTDIWYTDSGWWTQSTSWWTFLWFLWFWSRGWAMLTFKSHAIVYEWIKHILYSAYNCANAARRLLHLWEALLWFRWVDAACSGEHWGRCEHWALQSLVSNMGDNFGIDNCIASI